MGVSWNKKVDPRRRLQSDQVEARFVHLLAEAGVNPQSPTSTDLDRLWVVMGLFSAEPVGGVDPPERDGDALLAQFGTYDWRQGDGEHFELDVTRQLVFSDQDGDYDHTTQLSCTLDFAVTDELRALGSGNLWSTGMGVDEFVAQARALPGFELVQRVALDPQRLRVQYEQV